MLDQYITNDYAQYETFKKDYLRFHTWTKSVPSHYGANESSGQKPRQNDLANELS